MLLMLYLNKKLLKMVCLLLLTNLTKLETYQVLHLSLKRYLQMQLKLDFVLSVLQKIFRR
ncbi:hypothetical protein GPICK_00570 [Geobacter pickeringii]|uniref:Uncharacterized protein n=1 Tax=Geobacter pickeringii TaxID=345632 RepID=A0A0B5BAT1_9BACT|nr:hypothetical protein GPICK_00570 [Geobacter pickeringii]